MIHRGTWSAPANVLIAGEYAITRDGGVGLAVAVEPRGTLDLYEYDETDDPAQHTAPTIALRDGGTLTVTARMGGPQLEVRGNVAELPLVTAVVESVDADAEHGSGAGRAAGSRRWHVEIDTSAFFDPRSGAKKGLGSSAVTTLLLAIALKAIYSPDAAATDPSSVVSVATAAHRYAHGGRGSGYDIATSAIGGAVRFTGGNAPTWAPSKTVQRWRDAGISLYTATGRAPVSSGRAVERFDYHIPPATHQDRTVLTANNKLVDTVIAASDWPRVFTALSEAARHGVAIGEQIGVSATLPFVASHADDGWVAKASGAGNERSVFLVNFGHRRPLPGGVRELTLTTKGLRCEFLNL